MFCVSKINVIEDVALISFNKGATDINLLSEIFDLFAKAQINVDMISQTASQGKMVNLSFTVPGECLGKALELIAKFKDTHPSVKPLVRGGNSKIALYGEDMRRTYGVAAKAFRSIVNQDIEICMITTSETDISLLVANSDLENALDALSKEFEVESEPYTTL